MTTTSQLLKISSLALLVAVAGCRKHEDGTPVGIGGTVPGNCVVSLAHYQGAVAANPQSGSSTDYQTIQTNANVLDHPYDRVDTTICKNVTIDQCANTPPALDCAGTWDQPTTPCYRTHGGYITFGRNTVILVNAAEAGFSAYSINTTICR